MIIRITFKFYNYNIVPMSREIEENLPSSENVTPKRLVEVIKTSKQEYDSEQRSNASTPSVIQYNTLEIIEKIDSKIPSYVQLYFNLYKKYLQMARNFCNASCITQKEIFDKIGVNDSRLAMFDAYLESVKKMVLFQIDVGENMIKSYVDHRLTFLEFYDQMMSRNISGFAKMFSRFNDFNK